MEELNSKEDFLPITLESDTNETESVSFKSYEKAFLRGIEGIKVEIKLSHADGKSMKDFMKVENEIPFYISGYGIIKVRYSKLNETKKIHLVYVTN